MISIIIPIKNNRIVSRLLEKLTTFPEPEKTEILIIDASQGKLKDIQNKFPQVKWLDYKASSLLSVAEQRNYGIKMAKGDVIVFIDADCIPTKNWLSEIVKPIRAENENITAGYIKSVRKYPRKWALDHEKVLSNKYVEEAATMNSAFKKSVFEKIGDYDKKFEYGGEDIDLCYRARKAGYKIRSQPKAIIYHDWDDISRNISRVYLYGRASYRFFKKHFRELGITPYTYGVIIFPLFLLFLPITYIFWFYPLILFIPFFRNYLQFKSIELAIEHIIFGLLNAVGFWVELLSDIPNLFLSYKTSGVKL